MRSAPKITGSGEPDLVTVRSVSLGGVIAMPAGPSPNETVAVTVWKLGLDGLMSITLALLKVLATRLSHRPR